MVEFNKNKLLYIDNNLSMSQINYRVFEIFC